MDSLRIGGGAGFLSDRLDSTLELIDKGDLDAVILDALAERTLAQLHNERRNGGTGYWKGLGHLLENLLPVSSERGTRVITNAGGASPVDAAKLARDVAKRLGLGRLKIAAITGDDVHDLATCLDPIVVETGDTLSKLEMRPLGANAYLGSEAIAEAYRAGADVIIAGRVTDSALALGPIMASLRWEPDYLDGMACGVLAGHLLECGPQLSGGYFADPGVKDVPDLDRLGFPIGEVSSDCTIVLSKVESSGGLVDRHTVIEQMLYEIQDPRAYVTPDVVLDLSGVEVNETGNNTVRVAGARGKPRPAELKVLISVDNGFVAEAEISYGGISAERKARLAAEIVWARIRRMGPLREARIHSDFIGFDSLWPTLRPGVALPEVRLRFCGRFSRREPAELLVKEIESLYTSGPSGGGGVRSTVEASVRTLTTYLPRSQVSATWSFVI